jgi:hypothetical protein
MPLIERDGDSITLQAPLVTADRARQIPGARHDAKRRVWRYPLSWATCVVARGVFGDELEVGPELTAWARHELETRIIPAMAARQEHKEAQ